MSDLEEIVNPDDVHVHVCSCGQKADTRFMTGSDWYDRFEKEFRKLEGVWPDVIEAAKKASGLK